MTYEELDETFRLKTLPDVTIRVPAGCANAWGLGQKILVAGQPGFVISMEVKDGALTAVFRPTGPPVAKLPISLRIPALWQWDKPCYVSPTEADQYLRGRMHDAAEKLMKHRWPPRHTIGVDWARKDDLASAYFGTSPRFMIHDEVTLPPPTKEQPLKIRNKFYVAAPSVTTHSEQDQVNTKDKVHLTVQTSEPRSGKWTRNTLKDAVEHAEQILDANPKQDHVAIVQIVRIVRRKKQPIVVETVR